MRWTRSRDSAGKRFACLLVLFTSLFAVMLGATVDSAGKFPERPINFIVPWSAGGATDLFCRVIGQYAEEHLGVPVVIINQPGGGSTVGMTELANSPADGYTIGVASTALAVSQYISDVKISLSNYAPVAFIGFETPALTVRADSKWATLDDFVEDAKANPGKIRNANDQLGGGSHLAALEVERACEIQMNLIAYPGYAPSVAALLGGHVESTTVPVTEVDQLVKSGDFRVLGVLGPERHFLMPDEPTFKEQRYDGEMLSWDAIMAPKGTPTDRIAILEQAFLKAMHDPELQETALKTGWQIIPKDSTWTNEFLLENDSKIRLLLSTLGF